MRLCKQALLLASIALLALACTGTASANRFSYTNQRFKRIWTPLVISGFATDIRCNVTVEGSFHSRTLVKTPELLVGYINRATIVHPCTGGEAWVYNGTEVLNGSTLASSLPWHVRYAAFEGELPNISKIIRRLFGIRILAEAIFLGIRIRCNYTSNAGETFDETGVTNGSNTTASLHGEIASEAGCPRARISGEGTETTPEGATVSVKLI